jgi:hypothetical protein
MSSMTVRHLPTSVITLTRQPSGLPKNKVNKDRGQLNLPLTTA